jgi:hypothetical protein
MTAKDVEDQHLALIRAIRGATTIPLAVKIGAQFSCLPNFVAQMAKAGADGVVLFNRYLEPDVDLNTLQLVPQLTLSQGHEMRLPMRWIGILRDQVALSLAASGGVQSAKDVAKLILAGADVVMMTSTLLKRGSGCVADRSDIGAANPGAHVCPADVSAFKANVVDGVNGMAVTVGPLSGVHISCNAGTVADPAPSGDWTEGSGGNGCQDGAGTTLAAAGELVSVRALHTYQPMTPVIGSIVGSIDISGAATMVVN